VGNCPSPTLWWSVRTSVTVASLVHSRLIGGSHQTHLLQQACLLKVHTGICSSPNLVESPSCQPLLQDLSTPSLLGGSAKPTFSGRLVYSYSLHGCLILPPFSGVQVALPSLLYVLFSSLFIIQFFFFVGRSVCPGNYASLSQGCLGEYCMTLGAHLPNVSQAGLEPLVAVVMVVAMAAHLFSQCNVVWRSFLQARGWGCQSFDSPWCFISAKCYLQHLSKVLESWSSRFLVLHPSRHLRSFYFQIFWKLSKTGCLGLFISSLLLHFWNLPSSFLSWNYFP
jgi:hypothetical protein